MPPKSDYFISPGKRAIVGNAAGINTTMIMDKRKGKTPWKITVTGIYLATPSNDINDIHI